MSNLIKILQMGAKFFHADGQTDGHDEADSRFSQFKTVGCLVCKNCYCLINFGVFHNTISIIKTWFIVVQAVKQE